MKYTKEDGERIRKSIAKYPMWYVAWDITMITEMLLDEIDRMQQASRWIPVSDPPKEKGNYLVSDGESVIEETWYGSEWGCSGVKCWKFKPTPPEGG